MGLSSCNENNKDKTENVKVPDRYELANDDIHVVIEEGDTVQDLLNYLSRNEIYNLDVTIDNCGYGYKVNPEDFAKYEIDLKRPIYFSDRFLNRYFMHLSIKRDDVPETDTTSRPMFCSELIQILQQLMKEHGDVMITIPDTDGAGREYPITSATFLSKVNGIMFQDRIMIE